MQAPSAHGLQSRLSTHDGKRTLGTQLRCRRSLCEWSFARQCILRGHADQRRGAFGCGSPFYLGPPPVVVASVQVATRHSAAAADLGLYAETKQPSSCLWYSVGFPLFFGGSPVKLAKAAFHLWTGALPSAVLPSSAMYAYVASSSVTALASVGS